MGRGTPVSQSGRALPRCDVACTAPQKIQGNAELLNYINAIEALQDVFGLIQAGRQKSVKPEKFAKLLRLHTQEHQALLMI